MSPHGELALRRYDHAIRIGNLCQCGCGQWITSEDTELRCEECRNHMCPPSAHNRNGEWLCSLCVGPHDAAIAESAILDAMLACSEAIDTHLAGTTISERGKAALLAARATMVSITSRMQFPCCPVCFQFAEPRAGGGCAECAPKLS